MYVTFDQSLRTSLCAVIRQVPGTATGESGSGEKGMSSVAMPARMNPPLPMVALGEGQTMLMPWRSCLVSSVYRAPRLARDLSDSRHVSCPNPAQEDSSRSGWMKDCE